MLPMNDETESELDARSLCFWNNEGGFIPPDQECRDEEASAPGISSTTTDRSEVAVACKQSP